MGTLLPGPLAADELREAADVDVLGDLCSRPQLGEGAAIGAVADLRVLYIDVRADAALLADFGVPLMTEKGSIVVSWPMVTLASMNVVSGSAMVTPSEHLRREDAEVHDRGGLRQPDPVLDPGRLVGIGDPDDT